MPTVESGKSRVMQRPPVDSRVRILRYSLDDDPRRLLVERIAASRRLGKSVLLVEFLRYICDRQIRGKDSQITEQQIGVKVFGRVDGYNTNDDNIVRNYARTLRKRLEEYFRREGREEPLILVIPRGGYVPVFLSRDSITQTEIFLERDNVLHEAAEEIAERGMVPAAPVLPAARVPPAAPVPPAIPEMLGAEAAVLPFPIPSVRQFLLAGALVCCFAGVGLLGFLAGQHRGTLWFFQSDVNRANRLLWNLIFEDNRDTFVVPADGGLVMMQSFTRQKVALPSYVNGSYRVDSEIAEGMQGLLTNTNPIDQTLLTRKISALAARRYTSIVDLEIAMKVAQLPEVRPERLVLRYARDFQIDDVRNGNAILIGSNDANPWVSLFEQQLNFQFAQGNEFGGSGTIINMHPLPGERDWYASVTGDTAHHTYGVIAFLPNLEGTGHVLLIEGVNMAGTQAAGDFLLSPEEMQPILERASDAHGKLHRFEVLLETTSIAANASRSQVLSERVDEGPAR
jgi:hypothetical protein